MDNEKRLTGYNPQLHEAFLLAWFFHLRQTGDLDKVAHPSLHTLTTFLNHYANDVKLGFASDTKGIWFASWVRPLMNAGEFGLWIREDKRHSPTALKCLYESYNTCFQWYTTLIGISKQGHLKEIHEKMGYVQCADIPAVWSGNAVQVYYLTKDAYNERIIGKKQPTE